jgi:hypothetical protein
MPPTFRVSRSNPVALRDRGFLEMAGWVPMHPVGFGVRAVRCRYRPSEVDQWGSQKAVEGHRSPKGATPIFGARAVLCRFPSRC